MEIWRGGVSTRYVKEETSSVSISSGGAHDNDRRQGARLRFQMRSKGGGHSKVIVWIEPNDYVKLAAEMAKATPKAARYAFLKAMMIEAEKD